MEDVVIMPSYKTWRWESMAAFHNMTLSPVEITATVSLNFGTLRRVLFNTIISHVLEFCDLKTVARIACVSRRCRDNVRVHVRCRVVWVLERFVSNGTDLRKQMGRCGVVLTGSAALHIVLGHSNVPWWPGDLDFAISRNFDASWRHRDTQRLRLAPPPPSMATLLRRERR